MKTTFRKGSGVLKGVATLIEEKDYEIIVVAPTHDALQRAITHHLGIKIKLDIKKFKTVTITEK